MKNLKSYLAISLAAFLLMPGISSAQEAPSFRQNQFNVLLLNPAQSGANNYSDISTMVASMWTGIAGAPKSFAVTGNFNVRERLGIGISVLADQVGPMKQFQNSLSAAYHLKINDNWRWAMGLRAGVSSLTVDLTSLSPAEKIDPHLSSIISTGLRLKAGWGGLIYSEKYYFGFAQNNIGNTDFIANNVSQFVSSRFSFNTYVGGTFKLSETLDLRPNALIRINTGLPTKLDLNTVLGYAETFDIGLSYQLGIGIGAIFGFHIKDLLYVGYSYSYPTNDFRRVSSQSHELSLRYYLDKKQNSDGFLSPRFFN